MGKRRDGWEHRVQTENSSLDGLDPNQCITIYTVQFFRDANIHLSTTHSLSVKVNRDRG